MYHLDNEKHIKIGELVIAVKILSLIFLMIAVFIELPRQTVERYKFFNLHFSNNDFAILIGNAIICYLFHCSLLDIISCKIRQAIKSS